MAHCLGFRSLHLHKKAFKKHPKTKESRLCVSYLHVFGIEILLNVFFSCRAAGGVLFSFGSVLMWAFLKNLLPKNNGVTTFVGLTSGYVIVRLTTEYLHDVDAQISEVD